MNRLEWETEFATAYKDEFGNKVVFNPLHTNTKGSMVTTRANGQVIGGEYDLREDGNTVYLGWYGNEYLLRPTEKGFDLLSGETISYSFTRVL